MRLPRNMLHVAKAQQPKTPPHIDLALQNSHRSSCIACRPLEILVCSDGRPARVRPIFSLVFNCSGKYVSSFFFAHFGLINLRRGWGRSCGVFFRCILRGAHWECWMECPRWVPLPRHRRKDPGQGCYFSVGPGWLQDSSSARIVQA